MLDLDGLHARIQNRAVLDWDQHRGCTECLQYFRYSHLLGSARGGRKRESRAGRPSRITVSSAKKQLVLVRTYGTSVSAKEVAVAHGVIDHYLRVRLSVCLSVRSSISIHIHRRPDEAATALRGSARRVGVGGKGEHQDARRRQTVATTARETFYVNICYRSTTTTTRVTTAIREAAATPVRRQLGKSARALLQLALDLSTARACFSRNSTVFSSPRRRAERCATTPPREAGHSPSQHQPPLARTLRFASLHNEELDHLQMAVRSCATHAEVVVVG